LVSDWIEPPAQIKVMQPTHQETQDIKITFHYIWNTQAKLC